MSPGAFPSQVSEEFVLRYVSDMNDRDPDDPDYNDFSHSIRRFRGYTLRNVPLLDIFFDNEPYSASLAQAYAQMPAEDAPPVILDGVTWAPLDGFHRINAARLRADSHVQAYVGHSPHADWEPLDEKESSAFRNAAALHKLLSSSASVPRVTASASDILPSNPALALLQEGVQLEYVDAKGMTLLGAAVHGMLVHHDSSLPEALLAAGACPNRLGRFPNQIHRRSAWEEVLRYHHPNPTLYDPEHELPVSLLQAFLDNGLDLKLPAHDKAVSLWLSKKKGAREDGAVSMLERAWCQARLDTTLPQPATLAVRPRM